MWRDRSANNGGCWCPSVYQPQNGRRYCRLESRLPSNYNLASSLGNSFCNGYADREGSENEKRRKSEEGLPAKNRRVWTASFTRVELGSPGGFRQTNYYKFSPLRKFFSLQHSDMETSERAVRTAVLLLYALFIRKFCSVCCSVFHDLDSVVFHSDFCLASFLLFQNLLSNDFI